MPLSHSSFPPPQLTATSIMLSLIVCTLWCLQVDSSSSSAPPFFFCLTEMYCLRVLEARDWTSGPLRVGSFWGLWGIVRENQFCASFPGSGALRCSLAGRWHPPYSSTSFAQHVSEFFHGLVCISSPFLFYCWVAFYCLDSPYFAHCSVNGYWVFSSFQLLWIFYTRLCEHSFFHFPSC